MIASPNLLNTLTGWHTINAMIYIKQTKCCKHHRQANSKHSAFLRYCC